jgi:hypothetical protein
MSDEDFIFRMGRLYAPACDEHFEQTLEALIQMAQFERRYFLAYLLQMALMEARNREHPSTYRSH